MTFWNANTADGKTAQLGSALSAIVDVSTMATELGIPPAIDLFLP